MATITALLIPADGAQPIKRVELELEFFSESEWSSLKAMYPLMSEHCSCVERVQVGNRGDVPGTEFVFLWVDECGRMYDDAVRNDRASELYGYPLYGNAILCADSGYNTVSLPDTMSTDDYVARLDFSLSKRVADRYGVFVFNPETDRIIG